jgi:hypothetical protein
LRTGTRAKEQVVTKIVLILAGCCVSGFVGLNRYTVEIPAQTILVKKGRRNAADIVAVFPNSTRLLVGDVRLRDTDVLPYWPWEFQVVRNVDLFRYGVTLAVMGSPEEGLKYRDKSEADWHRPELEAWADKMLHRFEADTWDSWTLYRMPPTEAQEDAFKQSLFAWFAQSSFANQGIRIKHVVVNLPDLRTDLQP